MTWMRNNALAVVAIVIALSSGAYAVTTAPKDSVVSKSIKNGAVKAKDLAAGSVDARKIKDGSVTAAELSDGSVTAAKVGDNALTGADIDESTLSLPASLSEHADLLSGRLPVNTAMATVFQENGLTLKVGCEGASGQLNLVVSQEAGVGVEHYSNDPSQISMVEGSRIDDQIHGLQNSYVKLTYSYRRASDGASVWVDALLYNWNSVAPPNPISNDDCIYWLNTSWSG